MSDEIKKTAQAIVDSDATVLDELCYDGLVLTDVTDLARAYLELVGDAERQVTIITVEDSSESFGKLFKEALKKQ